MQDRPEPREGHAVPLVAQPVHGLRAPLHVLLRPRVRADRPTGRRTIATARRSGSRRTSSRSCAASSPGRAGRARPSPSATATDPYQPAEGRWRLTRGAIVALGEASHAVRAHHARPAHRPRPRRPRRGRAASGRVGHVLRAHARPRDLAPDRARDGATPPASPGAAAPRRSRDPRQRRDGAHPARPLRPPGPPGRRHPGGAGCRRDRRLGERPVPAAGHARALPRPPRRATGRSSCPTYERLYARGAYVAKARSRAGPGPRRAASPGAHGIADRRTVRLEPPPEPPVGAYVPAPGQMTLLPAV